MSRYYHPPSFQRRGFESRMWMRRCLDCGWSGPEGLSDGHPCVDMCEFCDDICHLYKHSCPGLEAERRAMEAERKKYNLISCINKQFDTHYTVPDLLWLVKIERFRNVILSVII